MVDLGDVGRLVVGGTMGLGQLLGARAVAQIGQCSVGADPGVGDAGLGRGLPQLLLFGDARRGPR